MSGVSGISIAARYIEGGRARFLEYVNLAALNGVDCAIRFWQVYADLGVYERTHASLDDIGWAASVKPHELMSAIVSTAMQHAVDVGNLVAASMHPDIVRQAAKSAKRIGGQHADIAFKDRLLLLQASGLAPLPKTHGTSVHVHNTASASAEAAAASKSETSVPTFADDMAAIDGATTHGQRALSPARPRTLDADGITEAELHEAAVAEVVASRRVPRT